MHDDIEYNLKASFSIPNLHLTDGELVNSMLYELEQLLNAFTTSLKDYKLPMSDGRLMAEIRNKLLGGELNYDIAELN
jgi:hypothetical protein